METNYTVGQEVYITNRFGAYIGVIKKITPTGIIRVARKNNPSIIDSFNSNGTQRGDSNFYCGFMRPLTDELKQELRQKAFISKVLIKMRNTIEISYAQAIQIAEILKNKEEEK